MSSVVTHTVTVMKISDYQPVSLHFSLFLSFYAFLRRTLFDAITAASEFVFWCSFELCLVYLLGKIGMAHQGGNHHIYIYMFLLF